MNELSNDFETYSLALLDSLRRTGVVPAHNLQILEVLVDRWRMPAAKRYSIHNALEYLRTTSLPPEIAKDIKGSNYLDLYSLLGSVLDLNLSPELNELVETVSESAAELVRGRNYSKLDAWSSDKLNDKDSVLFREMYEIGLKAVIARPEIGDLIYWLLTFPLQLMTLHLEGKKLVPNFDWFTYSDRESPVVGPYGFHSTFLAALARETPENENDLLEKLKVTFS